MEIVTLQAEKRDAFGKKATSQIRKEGKVPAVVYAKDGVQHVVISPKELKPMVYTPDFKLAEIDIDGAKHKAILQDIQFHPVTDAALHADFLRLVDGVPIIFNVPVRFEGVSPGVKAGGKLAQTLRRIKLKTTPDKLVNCVFGDISTLEMGDSLRIRDLKVPEGIEVMTSPAIPVAIIETPRAAKLETEEGEEEGAEEGAEEGEVTATV